MLENRPCEATGIELNLLRKLARMRKREPCTKLP